MKILRARVAFFAGHRHVASGALVDASDPVVSGREDLFEPVEVAVEQATAAPGEKRTTRRPRAKKPRPAVDG